MSTSKLLTKLAARVATPKLAPMPKPGPSPLQSAREFGSTALQGARTVGNKALDVAQRHPVLTSAGLTAGALGTGAALGRVTAPQKPMGTMDQMKDMGNKAWDATKGAVGSAGDWISKNPGTAAGVGLGAAGLLYWLLRRRSNDDE